MSTALPTEGKRSVDTTSENPPPHYTRWNQKDQDVENAKERRDAEQRLMQSWMDRLQLICLITTFFAATEAQLLQNTTPSDPSSPGTVAQQVANAGLCAGLVFHAFSAIIAFSAAFLLVGFRIREAVTTEIRSYKTYDPSRPSGVVKCTNPHLSCEPSQFVKWGHKKKRWLGAPTQLLQRCHALCISTAAIGFVLATIGVISFIWTQQSRGVAIFSSASLALCLLSLGVLFA